MKKILLYLVAASSVLISCTKEMDTATLRGGEVSVSFTASLPEAGTKAVADGDGAGIHADQCKLQVWWGDILFCEKTVAVADLKAKFEDIILIKDQKYDFLFWADNKIGGYYVADTLTKVRMVMPYAGNNDYRDAFYASVNETTVSESFSQTVVLKRPFGQLNIVTTDIPSLHSQFIDKTRFHGVLPDSVSLKVTAPTMFDAKTGKATVPAKLTYSAPVYASPVNTGNDAKNTLSMDYLFAPAEEGNVVDIEFSASNTVSGLTDINYTFANVPIRRNYRTNVIGALITVVGTISVEIDPAWTGEKDI